MNDYSEYQEAPSTSGLQQLSDLIEKLAQAEALVDACEADLSQAKEASRVLSEQHIPELMASLGVERFRTKSGLDVSVSTNYQATPLVANRDACWDWLEINGHGALVKREVSVALGKGQDEEAQRLVDELSGRFGAVKQARKVEPQTLKAWAREQIENGNVFPQELFGVQVMAKAKIKRIKND